jgi:hypothetical protein
MTIPSKKPGWALLWLAVLVPLSACVTGRERRPTQLESAATPAPRPELRHPDTADKRWVVGYWRWDGVRYVWVEGRLENKQPAYIR